MGDVRFFVLTPTYGREDHVVRCIQSVQSQRYKHWEMFIYDDGSPDETSERLKPFAVDDRIHYWVGEENRGANFARNFLLERILERGEPGYIATLDDDDAYVPDALERVAQEVEALQPPWIIAPCVDLEGQPLTELRRMGEIDYVRDHKVGNVLKGEVAHFFHTSLVRDARFMTRYRNAEEWYFYYALGERAKMWPIEFDAVVMEYTDDGLSRSQPNAKYKADLYRMKLDRLGNHGDRKARARLTAKRARCLFEDGERMEGLRMLARAFGLWPAEGRIYQYLLQSMLPAALGGLGQRP